MCVKDLPKAEIKRNLYLLLGVLPNRIRASVDGYKNNNKRLDRIHILSYRIMFRLEIKRAVRGYFYYYG